MSVLAPIRSELYRMGCTRGSRWAVVLPAIVGVVRILFGQVLGQMSQARQIAESGARSQVGIGDNGFGPVSDGLRTGGAVLAVIVLLLGAVLWVRERESGSLALAMLAQRRVELVLAKAGVLLLFVLAALAFLVAGCVATATLLYNLGPVVEDGFEMASSADLWSSTLCAVFASYPALLAAGCFGLIVSVLTASTATAITCTLVPFVLCELLQGLLQDRAKFIFVRYVPFLGEHAPLARLTQVARAYSDAGWESHELLMGALVSGATCFLFVLLSCVIAKLRSA